MSNVPAATRTLAVLRSLAASGPVTVGYATSGGSATPGADFLASSGTLTFAAGQTSQTITVNVAGDNAIVIGLAAAGLPKDQRTKVIFIGIAAATVLRIGLALVTTQLLSVVGRDEPFIFDS